MHVKLTGCHIGTAPTDETDEIRSRTEHRKTDEHPRISVGEYLGDPVDGSQEYCMTGTRGYYATVVIVLSHLNTTLLQKKFSYIFQFVYIHL